MDPFVNVVPELHDRIFQHLEIKDFQAATQVSPKWNKTFEKSTTMMKKVKFNIGCPTELKKFEKIQVEKMIANLRRSYRNVLVNFTFDSPGYTLLCKVLECLIKLAPKLHELEFRYFLKLSLSQRSEKLFEKIDLSGLKILKVKKVTDRMTHKLLLQCGSLTKLDLKWSLENKNTLAYLNVPPATFPRLKSFLERNQSLEEIEMMEDEYQAFFKEDITEITMFKLKRLKIENWDDFSCAPEEVGRNLLKFLATQPCLEEFHIDGCPSNVIEHLLNKMPALKTLTIPALKNAVDLKLNLNENITDLCIPRNCTPENFEHIIRCVPNVTKLKLETLTKEKVDIIANNLPALQKLLFMGCSPSRINDQPLWALLWPHATTQRLPLKHTFGIYLLEK